MITIDYKGGEDGDWYFFSLFVLAVMLAALFSETVLAEEVETETVTYGPGGETGFLAYPKEAGPRPALILIHEWWGLNDNIRDNARRFAEQGYAALAVDLYGGRVAASRDEARALAGEVRENREEAFANLKAAVDYLKGRGDIVQADRVGSVGWCFGGGWSYQLAKNDLGVRSSVVYYGFFNPEDDLSKMKAGIIGHFGEQDRAIKVDNVREFEARLRTLKGDHEIYIYPNAGHAFANESGPNYDREAAELAWERTLSFLGRTLAAD